MSRLSIIYRERERARDRERERESVALAYFVLACGLGIQVYGVIASLPLGVMSWLRAVTIYCSYALVYVSLIEQIFKKKL